MFIIDKIKNIFSGRVSRREYNINVITTQLVILLINKIIVFNEKQDVLLQVIVYILYVSLIFLCLQFYPLLIKRIHDINKSAWWLLSFPLTIFVIFNIIAVILMLLKSISSIFFLTGWLLLIIVSYYTLVITLMFKEGTEGVNRYGEPPKD